MDVGRHSPAAVLARAVLTGGIESILLRRT